MAKGGYIGVSNVAKKIKKMYIGVGGVAKKVKKAYIGVNGVAKLWWSGSSGFVWWAGYTYNGNQKVEAGSALGTIDATLDVQPSKSTSRVVAPLCVWKGKLWTSKDHYVYYSTDAGRTWTSIYNATYWFVGFFPENNDYLGLLALNSNNYSYIHRISASAQTTIDLNTTQITSTSLDCAVQCGEYIYFSFNNPYSTSYKQTIVYKLTDKTRTTVNYLGLIAAAASSSRIVAVYKNQNNNTQGLGYVDKGGTSMTMVDSSYQTSALGTYWKNKFWFYRPNLTYYSTDGTSWSSQASAPSGISNDAISNYNPEKMYIPYLNSSASSPDDRYGYSYTSNGLTWTLVTDPTTRRYFRYILDNPAV